VPSTSRDSGRLAPARSAAAATAANVMMTNGTLAGNQFLMARPFGWAAIARSLAVMPGRFTPGSYDAMDGGGWWRPPGR
jgi:hypothetical protein